MIWPTVLFGNNAYHIASWGGIRVPESRPSHLSCLVYSTQSWIQLHYLTQVKLFDFYSEHSLVGLCSWRLKLIVLRFLFWFLTLMFGCDINERRGQSDTILSSHVTRLWSPTNFNHLSLWSAPLFDRFMRDRSKTQQRKVKAFFCVVNNWFWIVVYCSSKGGNICISAKIDFHWIWHLWNGCQDSQEQCKQMWDQIRLAWFS